MGLSEREYTLQMCLQEVGLSELPPAISASYTKRWIKGICLARKLNGIMSYCMCENDGGKTRLKKDFGQILPVLEIVAIHPYMELDSKYIPDLRSNKQIIEFLTKNGYTADNIEALLSKNDKTNEQQRKDRQTVKDFVIKAAIKNAKAMSDEENRCSEIRNYSNRIQNEE